jgi:large subunit ribosomal protein L24
MASKIFKLGLKKGDTVKIRIGKHKGQTGKVVGVLPKQNAVQVEGIGLRKRHIRPSQLNPRGGTKEVHIPMNASKVERIEDKKGKK